MVLARFAGWLGCHQDYSNMKNVPCPWIFDSRTSRDKISMIGYSIDVTSQIIKHTALVSESKRWVQKRKTFVHVTCGTWGGTRNFKLYAHNAVRWHFARTDITYRNAYDYDYYV